MGSLRIALVAFAVLAVTSVALGDLTKKVGGTTFYISDSSVPWLTARESCLKKGMTLATIKSRAEADRLRSVLKSRSSNSFWIGATDQGQTGRWYWTSNGAGVGFAQWDHGEPNDLGRERCVEIRQVDRLWNNQRCTTKVKYVCERR